MKIDPLHAVEAVVSSIVNLYDCNLEIETYEGIRIFNENPTKYDNLAEELSDEGFDVKKNFDPTWDRCYVFSINHDDVQYGLMISFTGGLAYLYEIQADGIFRSISCTNSTTVAERKIMKILDSWSLMLLSEAILGIKIPAGLDWTSRKFATVFHTLFRDCGDYLPWSRESLDAVMPPDWKPPRP